MSRPDNKRHLFTWGSNGGALGPLTSTIDSMYLLGRIGPDRWMPLGLRSLSTQYCAAAVFLINLICPGQISRSTRMNKWSPGVSEPLFTIAVNGGQLWALCHDSSALQRGVA
ncbi:hypothetical protein AVEN_184420-1 [Araneus ventricosus]|uniref:Uncharacterized protein n=1 Tax=Araneus ventricosus TaxID=182803 RepID=A0A4Y2BFJ2_ARAVE|nr:hypothetical protein AVEN_184420-1 [Araneus ventricosus]